jgi:hypothetical protein
MRNKKDRSFKSLLPILLFILIFPLSAVSQLMPDAYEEDNSYTQASVIILNDEGFQRRNLHTAADEDWIKFYGIREESYRIEAVRAGSDCDIMLHLYDTDGITFLKNGDHGSAGEDEYLEWACEADGIYYVSIKSFSISGEDTGYDLRAFRPHSCMTGTISGKISNAVSGDGIADARIKSDRGDSAISETDGTYSMVGICGCDEEPITITADADGYETYTDTRVVECDTGNLQNIVMTPEQTVSGAKALIIAGGPVSGNDLWSITRSLGNSAYRALLYQGFTKESIYYLTPGTESDLDGNGTADDTDGIPNKENLQNALLNWALNSESLTIYLTGHGGNGNFRLNSTEILQAGELDGWLDTLQESAAGNITVICDTDEAGTFLSQLRPRSGKPRIVLGSTSSGQGASFLNQGLISFSAYFWRGISLGNTVLEAFTLAKQGTAFMNQQTPFLDDTGDALSSAADGTTAKETHIGNGTPFPGAAPIISSISPDQSVKNSAEASLFADVSDPDGIIRVWAVLIPPGYSQGKKTVTALPAVDLTHTAENRYEGKFGGFYIGGNWQAAVFASDSIGNISIPKQTTLTLENPPARKAIILAGGTDNAVFQSAIEKNAELAYTALDFQGYADKDLFFMTPASSPGRDALPTIANLAYALETWSGGNTQDLVLYLTGKGDKTGLQLNGTEMLSPAMLDNWLDTLQKDLSLKVMLVYDACEAGNFLPLLTPPAGKERIVIAGAGSDQNACLLSGGTVSFSAFFWREVMKGNTAGKAFSNAESAIFAFCEDQTPVLDDNGNGTGNDSNDGKLAAGYVIGLGIKTAEDKPVLESVSPEQLLQTQTSAEIWAAGMNAVEGIKKTGAVMTRPGEDEYSCETPAGEHIELVYRAASGNYTGTCENIAVCGNYRVAVYAEDMTGEISNPLIIRIQKDTGHDLPGDINGDCRVNLDDAVIGLAIIAGEDGAGQMRLNYAVSGADINTDDRVGLEEMIYILKQLAG